MEDPAIKSIPEAKDRAYVKPFIRSLSGPAEFWVVLFIGFGLGLIYQLWTVVFRHPVPLDDFNVLRFLGFELLILGVILWIGRIRGWSIATFGWRVSWTGTGAGILLFIAATMLKILVGISLAGIHAPRAGYTVTGLTVPVIIVLTIINPLAEEVLESGYFIHSLRRHGMWLAVLASSFVRGLLHSYQGFDGAACIFAGGILYGLVYWKWRQLWPLVIAHALDDFLGLLYLTHNTA